MMKWRELKIGRLKLAVGELRSIHGCNSRDPQLPNTSIVGSYVAVYWDGVEKYSQILKLEVNR